MTRRSAIEIRPYDPAWPALFEAERARLVSLFSGDRVQVEHVGSTAVPGLAAKPIVDVLLGVERLEQVEARIPALAASGYEYLPEHESLLPERRFFARPRVRPRAVHVHAVELASAFWERHLLFRDFLRANPGAAARYEKLKLRLAERFRDDREGYTRAKTEFVEAALARAGQRRLGRK